MQTVGKFGNCTLPLMCFFENAKETSDSRQCTTRCQHDLMIVLVDPNLVSNEDKEILESLTFLAGMCTPMYSCHIGLEAHE